MPGFSSSVGTILREGDPWPRDEKGPPLPAPTLADIDRYLVHAGYMRKGSMPTEGIADGTEFEVQAWITEGRAPHWRVRQAGSPPEDDARTVAVSVPPAKVAAIRQALADLMAHDELLRVVRYVPSLVNRFEASALVMFLPADEAADALQPLPDFADWRNLLNEESKQSLHDLTHYIEHGRVTTSPWPAVRTTLEDALREALSRSGAEGLAARDELLDLVRRFADAHCKATRTDDAEQQRIQAERG